jgi:hypothetical protein
MPKWSDKDERQYEHIKESSEDRGVNERRAKEIEGRAPNKASQGTGNPNKPLEDRTKRELYVRAKQLDIAGRRKMDKSSLVDAIREHR